MSLALNLFQNDKINRYDILLTLEQQERANQGAKLAAMEMNRDKAGAAGSRVQPCCKCCTVP